MKVSNKNVQQNIISAEQQPNNVRNTTNPSFGAGMVGNGIITTMDAIDRGGLVASFLVQDFFGLNIPRTATGFFRNSEVTGEYNYQEAAEVGIREFLSGPTMFAIPMLMLWGIKKHFGKSNDVPVDMIRVLGAEYSKLAESKGVADLKDLEKVKRAFYADMFENVLKNAYEDKAVGGIRQEAEYFANELMEVENLRKNKKTKSFIDKFRGKKVEGTAEDKMAALVERYADIRKQHAVDASSSFLEANIKSGNYHANRSFEKVAHDLRNFVEDAVGTLTKKAEKSDSNLGNMKEFISKFTNMRIGSRVLTNFSMVGGIIAFCSIIPKLYQLSDKNPGLKGLEDDEISAEKQQKTPRNAAVTVSSDNAGNVKETNIQHNEKSQEQPKQVAFCGATEAIGKVISEKNGLLAKFAKAFEFDGYNVSLMGLISACSIGVVIPRFVQAREENERKEVLFRDTTTIATIIFAAKAVQHIFAGICTKFTGFGLANLPKDDTSVLKKMFNYIRPHKGVNVLSSAELVAKYTNLEKYNGGIAGFAEFVDNSGGDIKKMFASNKEAESLLKQLYESVAKSKSYDNASNLDIVEALKDIIKDGKPSDTLDKLYAIFKDTKTNSFLRKAKVLNSSFNFATLFVVVPVLLGWLIPRLNESFTKKRMQAKKDAKNSVSTANEVKMQETKPQAAEVISGGRSKTSESKAFSDFIKA